MPIKVLGIEIPTFNDWLYYLCWTIALVLFAVAWLLLRGPLRPHAPGVRDSELAAASSGVNLARYKTLAFGISAFYAGVAGSLLAIATTFVNPDTFPIALSIFLLVGVVVGGLGSLWPLVFGAIFIHFMQIEWAQQMEDVIPDFMPLLGRHRHRRARRARGGVRRHPDPDHARLPGRRGRPHPQPEVVRSPRLRSRSLDLGPGALLTMRRPRLLIALLALAGAIATGATAAPSADPGIEDTTILLGATAPLSGPESATRRLPVARTRTFGT